MAPLFLLLVCLSWPPVPGDTLQSQISLLQHIMQSFQAEMTMVTERLHKVEGELSVTTDELNAVKYELRQAEDEITALKNQGGGQGLESRVESLEVSENITKEGVIVLKIELDQAKSEIKSLKSQLNESLTKTEAASIISELQILRQANVEYKNISDDVADIKSEIAIIHSDVSNFIPQSSSLLNLDNLTVEIEDLKVSLVNLTSGFDTTFLTTQSEIDSIHGRTYLLNQRMDSMNKSLWQVEQDMSNVTNDRNGCCRALVNKTDFPRHGGLHAAFEVTQSIKKSGWTTLNFDTVKLNVGEAYNATTGIFTAPVAGIYLFWADIDISYGGIDYNELYLKKGSDTVAKGYAEVSPSIDHNVISLIAVLHLLPRDVVHFEMMASYFALEGSGRSSFGGTLISEL